MVADVWKLMAAGGHERCGAGAPAVGCRTHQAEVSPELAAGLDLESERRRRANTKPARLIRGDRGRSNFNAAQVPSLKFKAY
jgi:hypothetical protein